MALAARFGVPVSTIKTWLRRTLESVRTDCLLTQPRETRLIAA
jgi:DNA-directed RNA polymerase specialized sigma24 family protein